MRATIGDESFEATLGTYGGRTFLGLRKALLTALGVTAGETVRVTLVPAEPEESTTTDPAPDTTPRLEAVLAEDDGLGDAWRALPDGHREEYGRWVAAAEDVDVQRARIARLRHRLVPGD